MNQRAAAAAFVPFAPGTAASDTPAGARFNPTVISQAGSLDASSKSSPAPSHQHSGSAGDAKPVVTLQRDGDKVTGIRIECVCGQVIDLSCTY